MEIPVDLYDKPEEQKTQLSLLDNLEVIELFE